MVKSKLANIEDWVNDIRNGKGNLIEYMLFLGLMTVITYAWMQVIKRMVD